MKYSIKHLEENNMSYFVHMKRSLGFAFQSFKAFSMFLVHAFFPFIFVSNNEMNIILSKIEYDISKYGGNIREKNLKIFRISKLTTKSIETEIDQLIDIDFHYF